MFETKGGRPPERPCGKARRVVTQTLITLLMLDAALVAVILISGRTAWPWICAYWVILTIKNAADWRR